MNHHRHLPLFIVVRSRLIYRRDSRAYYSCFLFCRLRIYYSAARFHFVFYRRARARARARSSCPQVEADKIHIVTLYRIKSRATLPARPTSGDSLIVRIRRKSHRYRRAARDFNSGFEPHYHRAKRDGRDFSRRALWKLRFLLDGATRIYQ